MQKRSITLLKNTVRIIEGLVVGALLLAPVSVSAQDLNVMKSSHLPEHAIWLDSLDVSAASQGWGEPNARKSVEGKPITIKGNVFEHGFGTHSDGELIVNLNGSAVKFDTMVGVDDEAGPAGSVSFEVYVDGQKKADSGVVKRGDEPKSISVDLTGAKRMRLVVTNGGDGPEYDHADWAGSMIILDPNAKNKPEAYKIPVEPAIPIASGTSSKPAIHGPRIVGSTPGRPFLFLIPATGEGPLTFAAKNLPAGLKLDPSTGIISGSLTKDGESIVTLTISGPKGTSKRKLKIVGGQNKLALTPPMGWNSWNVWAWNLDAEKVRAAADMMIKSGLAAHGFQYINIDDCWQGERGADGTLSPNSKFPDMKALSDYVHSTGLKIGIYSSPGPKTCAGFEGSYQHEDQDAETWAKWGIDYIKYDWCSYGDKVKNNGLDELQKPYKVLQESLAKCSRDIVYSLCQYGMGNVWEWGAQVDGNCWRTTGDITDSWNSMSGIAFAQDGHEKFAGPGHWNDPDMLVVGRVGWGKPHPTKLTPNEQITHITMWSLLSSPLLIGCDMSNMDQFTLDLLTNDEVLDINQDPLGKPAGRKSQNGKLEVWARPLWDGTIAAGLFNRDNERTGVTVKWSDLGLSGSQMVRDVWQNKDLGKFDGSYTASIPAHGAILIKIGRPNRTDW